MALNIPEDCGVAKIRSRAAGDAEEMVSTFGFRHDGTTSPQDTAQAISEAWVSCWPATGMSQLYSHVGVDVAIGSPGQAAIGEYNTNQQGSTGFQPLPSNCALLISKITAEQGKGSRGRAFLCAGYLSEGEVDQNGFLSTAALAGYGNSAGLFFNKALSLGGTCEGVEAWVLFHSGDSLGQSFGAPPTDVTAFSVQTQIATQRQRMRR